MRTVFSGGHCAVAGPTNRIMLRNIATANAITGDIIVETLRNDENQ